MNLRPRKRTSPQIPIVAMVDILVIVLLFIVATTTFKKKKKDTHLQIALPQSSSLGGTTAVKEVRKTLSVTKDKKIFLDGVEMSDANLAEALKALKSSKPDAKLELQADQDTPLGLLVKIWDALKAGGYSINEVPARIQRAAATQ
jgi:biopolymer transport protein ExbD